MDGENNGKPYVLMDDLGVKPTIFGNIHITVVVFHPEKVNYIKKGSTRDCSDSKW